MENKNGLTICPKCKSKDTYTDIPVEYASDTIVSEIKRVCRNCKYIIDYWCMGVWESEYKKFYAELSALNAKATEEADKNK